MPEDPVPPPPSPAPIFQALNGFQHTFALKAAIELDIFTHIGAGADTAAALAAVTQASERGLAILCDAMAVFGLLQREGLRYRLSRDAAAFLDRRSPAYLGSATQFLLNPEMMEAFARLPEAVRRGGTVLPQSPIDTPDSERWVSFARNMAPMQRRPAQLLAELLCPKPRAPFKVLDIAAGHGHFGIAVALRNPHAQVYALDWPAVLAVASENAAAAGVADRYHPIPGSAFDTDWGQDYDCILLPNFLHHFDPPTCAGLLERARAALAPGGELAVLDFLVDEDGVNPPAAALFGLIMLATTPHGQAYTVPEMEALLRRTGFEDMELHSLIEGMQRVLIAAP